jgi:hypothetical protein
MLKRRKRMGKRTKKVRSSLEQFRNTSEPDKSDCDLICGSLRW